jgi:hypothetical protein
MFAAYATVTIFASVKVGAFPVRVFEGLSGWGG